MSVHFAIQLMARMKHTNLNHAQNEGLQQIIFRQGRTICNLLRKIRVKNKVVKTQEIKVIQKTRLPIHPSLQIVGQGNGQERYWAIPSAPRE